MRVDKLYSTVARDRYWTLSPALSLHGRTIVPRHPCGPSFYPSIGLSLSPYPSLWPFPLSFSIPLSWFPPWNYFHLSLLALSCIPIKTIFSLIMGYRRTREEERKAENEKGKERRGKGEGIKMEAIPWDLAHFWQPFFLNSKYLKNGESYQKKATNKSDRKFYFLSKACN